MYLYKNHFSSRSKNVLKSMIICAYMINDHKSMTKLYDHKSMVIIIIIVEIQDILR